MMKRILGLILTAVFLSALCIPCAAEIPESATMKRRSYPGFFDVAEGGVSYEAIKLCYERGLMNGMSDTIFNPQGNLTIAQLVVLAARLYDLQSGGDGSVPELPNPSQSFARFYAEDGSVIASFSPEDTIPTFNGSYICLSPEEEAPSLPETCRLEIGFEGYNHLHSYTGTKQSFHTEPGYMTHGYTGTGYNFTDLGERNIFWYNSYLYSSPVSADLKSAWWYPAAFYLGSEGLLSLSGDLIYRIIRENNDGSSDYDPLTRFSSDHASRALFAWLIDLAAGELPVLNETVTVPDVNPDQTQDANAILRLYRAGVLTGVDAKGDFNGSGELTRAQAAIMLARVLEPSLRVKAS